MHIRRYQVEDSQEWDNLVEKSFNGTFLHTRRYLSYHGDRFQDVSLVIEDDDHKIGAVFPAAADPGIPDRVMSHPGITYGGIVHAGFLQGSKMVEALQAICEIYRKESFHTLRYKSIPHIYHHVPCSDDLYALFRLGARHYRCDLSATLDLESKINLVSLVVREV